jgi:hypothetical protein
MSFRGDEGLLFTQQQIHDPASPHMLPLLAAVSKATAMEQAVVPPPLYLAAVGQDVGVATACFIQGIGKDGQAVESPLFVTTSGESDCGGG